MRKTQGTTLDAPGAITAPPVAATRHSRAANAILTGSAALWFLAAIAGQWAFLYYIAVLYGIPALSGNFQAWTRNHLLIRGYIAGDTAGNLAFAGHTLLAAYVTFGGAVQLIPQIRNHAPSFHRWNGRLFLLTALGVSITGFYLVWVRGANPTMVGSVGTSVNAALIILFAGLAWALALRRDFARHRRWALRTYVVANGQWFFRVGVFTWIIVNRGPLWIGKHFDGPFILFWDFGSYLAPLAVLELYLRIKDQATPRRRLAMAGALLVLGALMAAGTFGAAMFLWHSILSRI